MKHPHPIHIVSALDGVSSNDDPLQHAVALSTAASNHGFDWQSTAPVFQAVRDELVELDEATQDGERSAIEHEVGDVLLAACNLARHLAVDPSRALQQAAARFEGRFRELEARAFGDGHSIADLSMDELEIRWQQAKRTLSERGGGA